MFTLHQFWNFSFDFSQAFHSLSEKSVSSNYLAAYELFFLLSF